MTGSALLKWTRGIGVILLPFGIIGDILKAPVYLVRATVATVQSALGSIGTRERSEKVILDMILQSFSLRFESTLMILIKLGIEAPDSLYRQFQNGNLNPFLTLTLFFTAFASRLALQDCICLASGKILPRDQCPAIGLCLFDSIHTLKTGLILAGLSSKRPLPEAAAFVEAWLPEVIQMLKEPKSCMKNTPLHLHRLLTIYNERGAYHIGFFQFNNEKKETLKNKKVLIIDEVSMVDAALLDYISSLFAKLRNDPRALGGMHVIVFGDLMQLLPVQGQKVFKASVWHLFLRDPQHQQDQKFFNILNKIRFGIVDNQVKDALTERW
jgi:hypothetical protein